MREELEELCKGVCRLRFEERDVLLGGEEHDLLEPERQDKYDAEFRAQNPNYVPPTPTTLTIPDGPEPPAPEPPGIRTYKLWFSSPCITFFYIFKKS